MVAITLPHPTIDKIDQVVAANEPRSFDMVVRGSSIGHQCDRHLWYKFRWAHDPEQFDGRKLRLFHTGHVEEARMVAWLRLAGVTVQDVDPATGEQWEVVSCDGHFAGHTDGIVQGLAEAPATPHLLECKTHNTKSFTDLTRRGVAAAKPEHVAQMQSYMHLLGLTRAFYMAKCKDTDELWSERIEYDPAHGAALMARAQRIKDSSEPLARVSDDPDYYLCKSFKCSSYGVCHSGQFALRNCRTCLSSTPVADGRWTCELSGSELSREDQQAGCIHHLYLPGLVPGRPDDADEEARTVTYHLNDGRVWVDGGRAA